MTDEMIYRIAMSMLRGINIDVANRLIALSGSLEQFFATDEALLRMTVGTSSPIISNSVRSAALERAHHEAAFLQSSGVQALWYDDAAYPSRLRQCADAPLVLYALGTVPDDEVPAVAIVGTRHVTPYGVSFITSTVNALASRLQQRPVIVSGLAYGADIAAHRAALNEGLPTAAVLAHGLDTIYPAAHRGDAARIIRSGGVLYTEYPHGSQIHRGNFLARNRIIAGLAECTIVAESAAQGGAMVTAHIAAEYSRDVFALPGRISDKYSEGCNKLIARQIASLAAKPDDIIAAMGWPIKEQEGAQKTLFDDLSDESLKILRYLAEHSQGRINEIAVATGLPIANVQIHLVDLDFRGYVTSYPGNLYRPAVALP